MAAEPDRMKKFEFLIGTWDLEYRVPRSAFGKAHAVFAWDGRAHVYRYWWFEDSGNFLTATCNFTRDGVLCLNWHDTLLTQTFSREGPKRVVLRMDHPDSAGKPETILDVVFTRR